MAGLLRFFRDQFGAPLQPPDALQRARQPVRVARKLHRSGISEVFPLPRDSALDHLCEKDAYVSDHNQANAKQQQDHAQVALLPTARVAVPSARKSGRAHQAEANHGDGQNARKDANQADIQAHVAVNDVAEFVRDHPLQLLAAELLDATTGHPDDSIAGAETGSESVDAFLLLQQVHWWNRRARGKRHFLHHIQQSAFTGVARGGIHRTAPQHFRHGLPALL